MMIFKDPIFLISAGVFLAAVCFMLWLVRQWQAAGLSESNFDSADLAVNGLSPVPPPPPAPVPDKEPFSYVPPPVMSIPPALNNPKPEVSAAPNGGLALNEEALIKLVDSRFQALAQRLDSIEKMSANMNPATVDEMKRSMEEMKLLLGGIRDGGEDVLSNLNNKMDVIHKVIVNLVSDFDSEKVK